MVMVVMMMKMIVVMVMVATEEKRGIAAMKITYFGYDYNHHCVSSCKVLKHHYNCFCNKQHSCIFPSTIISVC